MKTVTITKEYKVYKFDEHIRELIKDEIIGTGLFLENGDIFDEQ